MIRFKCPKCGEAMDAPKSLLGSKLDCPICKHSVQVPFEDAKPGRIMPSASRTQRSEQAPLSCVENTQGPESKSDRIQYNCWTCGVKLQSLAANCGKREICPKCKTPNVVPRSLGDGLKNETETCFFCENEDAQCTIPHCIGVGKYITKPVYQCLKCGNKWDVPATAKASVDEAGVAKASKYEVKCFSCSSQNVVPIDLPAMPIGKYYRGFSIRGVYKDPEGKVSLHLFGIVSMLRCKKCAFIHNTISLISTIVMVVTGSAGLAAICIAWNIRSYREGILELLSFCIIAGFGGIILGMPGYLISAGILKATIGRKTKSEGSYIDFPALTTLQDDGWKEQVG